MNGRQEGSETDLAEFLALVVRQQRPQRLETGVDALHSPPLVAVGDFPPDPLLGLHCSVQAQGIVLLAVPATATTPPSFTRDHQSTTTIAIIITVTEKQNNNNKRSG